MPDKVAFEVGSRVESLGGPNGWITGKLGYVRGVVGRHVDPPYNPIHVYITWDEGDDRYDQISWKYTWLKEICSG